MQPGECRPLKEPEKGKKKMLKMKYIGLKTEYDVEFSNLTKNLVQVKGDVPAKTHGFTLSRPGKNDGWDYSAFTTIYREMDGIIQFSNDGSIYVPPEPTPEPEPYVPTLEEVRESKKQEIRLMCKSVISSGVDVTLSTGTEHFPLTDEDITFLMGKQFEMAASESEYISYQDSEEHCKFYSRSDMQAIIQTALLFVNFQTTYKNNLCDWVDECKTKEEVELITYGAEIPVEYQNDVYKSYLVKMEE